MEQLATSPPSLQARSISSPDAHRPVPTPPSEQLSPPQPVPPQQASNASTTPPVASVIIPVHNAAAFLHTCLCSVLMQQRINIAAVQLVVYDDASTDNSFRIASNLLPRLETTLHSVLLLRGDDGPLGVGSARNRACRVATGDVFVFLDADDLMHPLRVARSLAALHPTTQFDTHHVNHCEVLDVVDRHAVLSTITSAAHGSDEEDAAEEADHRPTDAVDIVGGRFRRFPKGSTPRYEQYHYRLQTSQLFAHAFRDAPLPMPTIACRSAVWHSVPFVEGRAIPEDLHFLYSAMAKGFRLHKLQGVPLVYYRFHDAMTSNSLHRRSLLAVRVQAFEQLVLSREGWKDGFSIWNSGRDGKDVYNLLSSDSQDKVRSWGDIDPRKIGNVLRNRPIVHFSQLSPPIACCVPLDREGREFEANLESLNLQAGTDYVHLI